MPEPKNLVPQQSEIAAWRSTLEDTVNGTLDQPLGRPVFNALLDINIRLKLVHELLVEKYLKDGLTPEQYLDRMNALMRINRDEGIDLLGLVQYVNIFGEAGLHPEGMIDRDIFLANEARYRAEGATKTPASEPADKSRLAPAFLLKPAPGG